VLDDFLNLIPVWDWLEGSRSTTDVLLEHGSSRVGRPLAVLTLMANASISGADTLGFKLVNLLLHGFAGVLALVLLRRFQQHIPSLTDGWLVVVIAVWMIHPWQVSTVLYVVQRMTILGAIAQLAALLIYLEGRSL